MFNSLSSEPLDTSSQLYKRFLVKEVFTVWHGVRNRIFGEKGILKIPFSIAEDYLSIPFSEEGMNNDGWLRDYPRPNTMVRFMAMSILSKESQEPVMGSDGDRSIIVMEPNTDIDEFFQEWSLYDPINAYYFSNLPVGQQPIGEGDPALRKIIAGFRERLYKKQNT